MNNDLAPVNCSASGSIELVGNNWLHMKLDTLLPSAKNNVGSRLVSNTITNLLNYYAAYHDNLPFYENAFVAIIEHCNYENVSTYDHDNKGFRAVPNALKGRVFGDDNQFEMSLGLFTKQSQDEFYCEIYVLPMSDLSYFALEYLIF